MKELLAEEMSKSDFEGVVVDLLRYRLQMELKKKLSKICPLREIIMRVMKLEESEKVKVEKVEIKKEAKKADRVESKEGKEKDESGELVGESIEKNKVRI